MARKFDIIVFGATGVTGRYAVEQMYKASKEEGLSFAVAGRNESKLIAALEEVAGWMKIDAGVFSRETPKIIADVSDSESLHEMAKSARVIVNTVGPYRFYGEPVVSACVNEGTNHVDVSGEPWFIESMQLKYHKAAQAKKIYLVSACGFDSIPAEFAVNFAKENFRGRLNSVETFVSFKNPKGGHVNVGTWNSIIHGVANWGTLAPLRKEVSEELFTKKTEKPKFKLPIRRLASTTDVCSGYIFPFYGSDKSVIMKSEMFRRENSVEDYKPVQIQTYLRLPNFVAVIGLTIIGLFLMTFAKFASGRKLLSKYPAIFSFGLFRDEMPKREQLEEKSMNIVALGKGWHTDDDETLPPTKEIVVEVDSMDPGYIATSIMLVQSAVCILKDNISMPLGGGCISPGYAFEKTTLRNRLDQRGIKFSVKRQS
ncbi:saccharopine dehydrogenase-like oxidoreductase isoform X1 [Varroa destructor]|uniref:Saccharopine dehydrogenase NADP binding domain-containing protein n=1 Tax=Varroa destructor TaxID=109461 RepID=A0A7M7KNK8_VARDE|nr:saccharopine dehydrogenase-like oxidoreductase isoform X1 [Varroa destructor]